MDSNKTEDELNDIPSFAFIDTDILYQFIEEAPKLPKSLGWEQLNTLEALKRRAINCREANKPKTVSKLYENQKPWFFFYNACREFEFDQKFKTLNERDALLNFMKIIWNEIDFTIIQWNIWKKKVLSQFSKIDSLHNSWRQLQPEISKRKTEIQNNLELLKNRQEEIQNQIISIERGTINLDDQAKKINDNIEHMTNLSKRKLTELFQEIQHRQSIMKRLNTMKKLKIYIIILTILFNGGLLFLLLFIKKKK